jgi:hypothetical protein
MTRSKIQDRRGKSLRRLNQDPARLDDSANGIQSAHAPYLTVRPSTIRGLVLKRILSSIPPPRCVDPARRTQHTPQ